MQAGKKRALLIGINYYNSRNELAGCINDIKDVAQVLVADNFDEIVLLQDHPEDKQHVNIDCPTKANIEQHIVALVGRTQPGDLIYLHYSGHGTYEPDQNGDEKDKNDEAICPVDFATAGMLIDDDLRRMLVDNLPAGAHGRYVFDSCHSGSVCDLPCRWKSSNKYDVENDKQVDKDVLELSGCQDSQTSADARFGGRPNGALTWAYLQTIKEIHGSKYKSQYRWKDLVTAIRHKLRAGNYDQLPQLSFSNDKIMNDIVDL